MVQTVPSTTTIDSATVGKLQRRLLPLLFPLYVVAFLRNAHEPG